MLELTEQVWEKYNHAYGVASDIPVLLKHLSEYPRHENSKCEPYFSLWSSLCHQGAVYQASYAAVPHIVGFLQAAPADVALDYYLLPVCIEVARKKGRGPVIKTELESDYHNSFSSLLNCVPRASNTSVGFGSVLSATVAVCNGHHELAEVILELDEEVIREFWGWFDER